MHVVENGRLLAEEGGLVRSVAGVKFTGKVEKGSCEGEAAELGERVNTERSGAEEDADDCLRGRW